MFFFFLAGCAFLPFVWAINTFWFFNEAFRKPEYEEQKDIKKCKLQLKLLKKYILNIFIISDVFFSGLGSIVWIIAIAVWITVFQNYRADWGEAADNISFIIPLGKA